MRKCTVGFGDLDFLELEESLGMENARAVLRTLEWFEGIRETDVSSLSFEDRLDNVLTSIRHSMHFQTKH